MSFFFLASFLFMLYANPALLVPGLAAIHPAQLAGVGAMAVLTVQKAAWGEAWKFSRPEGLLMLLLVFGAAVSCLSAFWPRLAFDSTVDLLKIVIIYFVIVNCVGSEPRLKLTVIALLAGGIFPAAGAISNYLHGNFVEGNRAAWIGTYANPNDLAFSVAILIPLALQMSRIANWVWKPVFWGVLCLYLAAIFATQSRGGLIGTGAVLVLLGLRQQGIGAKLVTACALAGVLVFALFYWGRNAGFQNISGDFTAHQRMETILGGLRMFADYPLTGVGFGCSLVAWPLYAPAGIDFKGTLIIHNTAVQALSELGLLGFVPFVLLIGAAWIHVRRVARNASPSGYVRKYAVALEASLVGVVVCGLFGGYVLSWFPYIVIGLISALKGFAEENRDNDEVNA